MTSLDYSYDVRAPVEAAYEHGMKPENWARHFSEMDDLEVIEEFDNNHRTSNVPTVLEI